MTEIINIELEVLKTRLDLEGKDYMLKLDNLGGIRDSEFLANIKRRELIYLTTLEAIKFTYPLKKGEAIFISLSTALHSIEVTILDLIFEAAMSDKNRDALFLSRENYCKTLKAVNKLESEGMEF